MVVKYSLQNYGRSSLLAIIAPNRRDGKLADNAGPNITTIRQESGCQISIRQLPWQRFDPSSISGFFRPACPG